ncbi:ATP-binding protein [Clostridium aminobutyricum]|uniref:histidine kinase n=1 Tax=Clostridium aminobutyricum TaxID=33953 RepID=A0A939IJ12_CLOAM|nr:ATP-binding protein [Clostridium aminobutyricum]MBN7773128.1 PAS domain-containing sensor histidine kinase [Clostridium aminobutyricum]
MKRRIFISLFILSAISIGITSALVSFIMYSEFYKEMRIEVKQEAKYVAAAANIDSKAFLADVDRISKDRITWIDAQGNVLYDSEENIANMDNHADRPEVKQALLSGEGDSVRMSATLGEQTFYYAIKLNDESIIRVANTKSNVYATLAECLPYVLLVCLFMLFITIFVAKKQTKSIVLPINTMDLEKPLSNDIYDEFAPLLRKLDQQNKTIADTYSALKAERKEFASITENMNEGLLILNAGGEVLFANQKVMNIFSKSREKNTGGHYLTLNRSSEFREAVEEALLGEPSERRLKQNGRCYQLMATPTYENGTENDTELQLSGAVVLVLDITEKEEADKMRREFSSNVSHELKTPLTSISGYAEIMEAGIVKPEDIADFAGKIHTEAKRLIALVADIMKLSKLDEGTIELVPEEVDLRRLAQEVVERLSSQAASLKVSMTFEGPKGPILVKGVRTMLDEMIYNLCENAIKYNHEGGNVTVIVEPAADHHQALLKVSDTGIGIPIEHQDRIFERFYRVDKSHSKETGGTGLGLSIVKHVAKYHQAEIKLESQEGKGTTISVTF